MSRVQLEGRGVLVSGATGGIGRAVARRLAERGARVALMSRPSERLDGVVDELAAYGAIAAPADITDREEVRVATDEAAEQLGGLVGAVACGGLVMPGTIAELEEEDAHKVIDVNLYGTLWTLQAALPHVDREGGHLLALASIAGLVPTPIAGVYPASKAAVSEIVAQLRMELMRRPTSAGVVYFGKVDTGMADDASGDDRLGRIMRRTPGLGGGGLDAGTAAQQVVDALERRRGVVVSPAWQLPIAVPQLAVQRAAELGMRLSPVRDELPGRAPVG